ncbi:ChrR family anti-sigma-E factor [Alteromonas sp. RKMC-009]|uniref:ChrR family anti-sigma-E factor n=1 Tax=Alteromonas sp. RKMC-009 TaxID=2267264 RepID=UPI000E683885|nr:ChrR family anti-sigma-E factor [Alteromonas sp. RKMC-009]AYA65049.1 anti-sigma factor [Alteromonas sp. RKMC-009]MEC7689378.1 ChrR family anti-sigma-E factor [Pseudomonadota bacterium]
MINHHPEQNQLSQFVQGSLSPAESFIVSAHCDLCPRCRKIASEETSRFAAEVFDFSSLSQDEQLESYSAMLADITQLPATAKPATKAASVSSITAKRGRGEKTIELDGQTFELPPTLQRVIHKTGSWSGLVGKLWQAPVDLGYAGVANFIYMGRGGSVPEHTHRGVEYTLVLDGEFHDGKHHYRTGDFLVMDGKDTHAPYSDHISGCLVFTLLDEPLHFTSGIARLLNPFSHLFFR